MEWFAWHSSKLFTSCATETSKCSFSSVDWFRCTFLQCISRQSTRSTLYESVSWSISTSLHITLCCWSSESEIWWLASISSSSSCLLLFTSGRFSSRTTLPRTHLSCQWLLIHVCRETCTPLLHLFQCSNDAISHGSECIWFISSTMVRLLQYSTSSFRWTTTIRWSRQTLSFLLLLRLWSTNSIQSRLSWSLVDTVPQSSTTIRYTCEDSSHDKTTAFTKCFISSIQIIFCATTMKIICLSTRQLTSILTFIYWHALFNRLVCLSSSILQTLLTCQWHCYCFFLHTYVTTQISMKHVFSFVLFCSVLFVRCFSCLVPLVCPPDIHVKSSTKYDVFV